MMAASVTTTYAWEPKGDNIKTRWAAQVSPQNARTEYPRPQMVRADWKSLNGLWDYAVTAKDAAEMGAPEGQILVPFCIESSLSGVCRRVSEDQALWYKTTIEAPSAWQGKRIRLNFDAVDWKAEVFLNGEPVCTHTGGYTAFSVDVTPYLAQGPAELCVKVWDPTDDPACSIPRGKQIAEPEGIWYTPVTGIWQSVWMEPVSDSFIKDYNVKTTTDGTLELSVDIEGEFNGMRVELLAPSIGYDPENPSGKLAAGSVTKGSTATLKIARPKLWSTDNPYLYGLKIALVKDGKVVDTVNGYTSFRSFTSKADEEGVLRLALNDEIVFPFGPLDQGWWPDGLYTAPTAEAMAWDVVKTKELGFNMIRKHIKVEPSRWYYDCDRLGMMVWQDMPCIGCYVERKDWAQDADVFGAGHDYRALTPEIEANYYKEWSEIIAQLRKFQSIVMWIPFNEAWGQFDTQKVVDFTRAQDPGRMVNAASGGNWIKDAGDVVDSHYYPAPKMRLLDSTKVNVLGEYGGIGRPVEGHTWDIGRKWGYVKFDSEQAVTDIYCEYIQALLELKRKDRCAAAVYTQTTDVEGEVNGFFTYDREILKMTLDRVREANLRTRE